MPINATPLYYVQEQPRDFSAGTHYAQAFSTYLHGGSTTTLMPYNSIYHRLRSSRMYRIYRMVQSYGIPRRNFRRRSRHFASIFIIFFEDETLEGKKFILIKK